MINTASIINVSFLHMKEQIDELVEGGTRFFHIDLMDGHYVPNLCMPIELIAELKKAYPQVNMDIHMMVTDPDKYLDRLKAAGADYVSFHTDSTPFVRRTLNNIHKLGMKAGIVVNPSQRIDHIEPFIHCFDLVTLMAVEPGFSGQQFLDGSMERIQALCDLRKKHGASYMIFVDGGVDYEKGMICKQMGVDMIVGTRHTIFFQQEGILNACRRFEAELG